MNYYYLKDDDVIQDGDEWRTDSHEMWFPCNRCVGYINKKYAREFDVCRGWRVRRKLTKTKLGNIL